MRCSHYRNKGGFLGTQLKASLFFLGSTASFRRINAEHKLAILAALTNFNLIVKTKPFVFNRTQAHCVTVAKTRDTHSVSRDDLDKRNHCQELNTAVGRGNRVSMWVTHRVTQAFIDSIEQAV